MQYFDDIDHLGSLSIAYNMGIVFNPSPAGQNAAYLRNGTRYAEIYSALRKSNYFSEAVKQIIRDNPQKEYAVQQKGDGSWAFFEKYYTATKLYDINTAGRSTIAANNPFEAQQPFVRIEGYQSSTATTGTTLLNLNSNADIRTQTLSASINVNINSQRALRVTVTGNNSNDAICIRLNCVTSTESSVADYVIRLNFEGEREFILSERDNGTFSDISFPGKYDDHYAFLRADFNYSQVTGIQVYLSGACTGVRMSSIVATPAVTNAISNPTITIGGSSVTFNTTVSHSEYLEYMPGSATATKYSGTGAETTVTVTGVLPIVGSGAFEAEISADGAAMPIRATVTFGFTGPEVVE